MGRDNLRMSNTVNSNSPSFVKPLDEGANSKISESQSSFERAPSTVSLQEKIDNQKMNKQMKSSLVYFIGN
jgi:hypothetical protein